jgi:hypothetical protein
MITHVLVNIDSVQYSMFSGAPDGFQVLSELLVGLGSARDTLSGPWRPSAQPARIWYQTRAFSDTDLTTTRRPLDKLSKE